MLTSNAGTSAACLNMYGKKVRGIERSTFVIDGDGKMAREWRGVKVPGHAEDVLAFVKTL